LEQQTTVAASPAQQELSQLASEIRTRILSLEALFEDSLVGEMDALKACLIENPSAAALLKDEDVGLLVKNLRRTVSSALVEASKPKERKTKASAKTQFTPEQLQAALEEEGF